MSDLVTFTTDSYGDAEAYLGLHPVGSIMPWDGHGVGREFTYCSRLHDDDRWRYAHSLIAARRQLLQWLCGWFLDAGPAFQTIADAIAKQALRETESQELVSREVMPFPRPDSVNDQQMTIARQIMEKDRYLLRRLKG